MTLFPASTASQAANFAEPGINPDEMKSPSSVTGGDILLTPNQVATRLGVATGLLRTWRLEGSTGPRALVLSPRVVRYHAADVDAWLASKGLGGS
jgi:hypothetical protein